MDKAVLLKKIMCTIDAFENYLFTFKKNKLNV